MGYKVGREPTNLSPLGHSPPVFIARGMVFKKITVCVGGEVKIVKKHHAQLVSVYLSGVTVCNEVILEFESLTDFIATEN